MNSRKEIVPHFLKQTTQNTALFLTCVTNHLEGFFPVSFIAKLMIFLLRMYFGPMIFGIKL